MTKNQISDNQIYDIHNTRIIDKIVVLLLACGACSKRAVNNLSESREACSRAKKILINKKLIKETKRQLDKKPKKEGIIVKGTLKLLNSIKEQNIPYNTYDIPNITALKKRILTSEITSNFIRMGEDIYLSEADAEYLTKSYFVPYTKLNEFLTAQTKANHDTKLRLISGMYVTDDMLYPIYYVPEDQKNFYYHHKKSNITQQSRIRKLSPNRTNIIYLMSKKKHNDILKQFILNEEKRDINYTKFYRFDTQPNDTFLIPAKQDGTYEITKFAINPELTEEYKNIMSDKLEEHGYRRIYSKNYFYDNDLLCIYMPVIKVNEIRKCINEAKNFRTDTINIGLITFKENIDLLIDYINEVLVNQNHKKVNITIMNDLSDARERKAELVERTYTLGE